MTLPKNYRPTSATLLIIHSQYAYSPNGLYCEWIICCDRREVFLHFIPNPLLSGTQDSTEHGLTVSLESAKEEPIRIDLLSAARSKAAIFKLFIRPTGTPLQSI